MLGPAGAMSPRALRDTCGGAATGKGSVRRGPSGLVGCTLTACEEPVGPIADVDCDEIGEERWEAGVIALGMHPTLEVPHWVVVPTVVVARWPCWRGQRRGARRTRKWGWPCSTASPGCKTRSGSGRLDGGRRHARGRMVRLGMTWPSRARSRGQGGQALAPRGWARRPCRRGRRLKVGHRRFVFSTESGGRSVWRRMGAGSATSIARRGAMRGAGSRLRSVRAPACGRLARGRLPRAITRSSGGEGQRRRLVGSVAPSGEERLEWG